MSSFCLWPRWYAIHAPSFPVRFVAMARVRDATPDDESTRDAFERALAADDIGRHRAFLFHRMRGTRPNERSLALSLAERWLDLDASAVTTADEQAAIGACLDDATLWSQALHLAVIDSGRRGEDLAVILHGLLSPVPDCRVASLHYTLAHSSDPLPKQVQAAIAAAREKYGPDAFGSSMPLPPAHLPAAVPRVRQSVD